MVVYSETFKPATMDDLVSIVFAVNDSVIDKDVLNQRIEYYIGIDKDGPPEANFWELMYDLPWEHTRKTIISRTGRELAKTRRGLIILECIVGVIDKDVFVEETTHITPGKL